jgi:radical SAM superfamily enzyme YgiQ (UPF0313 family)
MRILFTAAPFYTRFDARGEPVGDSAIANSMPINAPYYLSALLEAHGHKVRIIDSLDMPKLWQKPDETAALFRGYDAVCISANSFTYWCAKLLLERLAGQKDLPPIILGGAHATHHSEHILRSTQVSYTVRGEGERALIALINALEGKQPIESVPNLCYRVGDEIKSNPEAPTLTAEELAEMPLPLWEQLPPDRYLSLPIEASRGCLFSCTFCSILLIRKWKGIPIESIVRRVDHASHYLLKARGKKYMKNSGAAVFFTDDCFTTDKQRLGELCQELGNREISYGMEGRATDIIKPGVMDDLTRMSLNYCWIGVECGYEEGLKKVRKGTKLEHVERAAQLFVEYGINRHSTLGYIQAFPWEGLPEISQTTRYGISMAAKYNHRLGIAWLSFLPGSELYDRAVSGEFGFFIHPKDYDKPFYSWETEFFRRTHPNISDQDRVEIDRYYHRMLEEYGLVQKGGDEVAIKPEAPSSLEQSERDERHVA